LLLTLILKWLVPAVSLIFPPWNLIGLLPLGLGIYFNLLADRKFHTRQTTVKPEELSSCLITDGVFRYSRNPMYAGMVLILFGFSILLNSWGSFLVLPGFTALINYCFIYPEEESLKEQFGEDWLAYQQKVPRWL
jgi:protein-S-isoprenylcysteine O-methyltransferase Ste14